MISDEITAFIVTQGNAGMSMKDIRTRIESRWCEIYATPMVEKLYNKEKNNPKYNPKVKPVLTEEELEEFWEWKAGQQPKE